MSRNSYRSSYKSSAPNPGGWITLLIIVFIACALCWPLSSRLVNGIGNAIGSAKSVVSGPQSSSALTIAVSPEKADLFRALVDRFNQQNLKSTKGDALQVATVQLDPESMLDAAIAGNFQAMSPDSSIWLDQLDRQYQAQTKAANGLVGQTVRYAVTPVVIAMWRDKAQAMAGRISRSVGTICCKKPRPIATSNGVTPRPLRRRACWRR